MGDAEVYKTIPQVDVAIGRAALRRSTYRALGLDVSVTVQTAVIDRLLDRRLILMGERR